nr:MULTISPECIES: universal stress protein [Myxococcaceae]
MCATDFSRGASGAATVAALLAARRRLALWLVHCASPEALAAAAEPVREGLQALLREEATRLRHLHADVHTALLEGAPEQVLAPFAAQRTARLVVVGAAARRAPFEGVGGSLDRIAQATALPLLRVEDPAPFEAWLSASRPLRVLLGVDRSRGTQAARAWLAELQEAGPLEVVAGHVFHAHDEARRLGLPQPRTFDEVTPELQRALERELGALAGPRPDGGPVPLRLRAGLGRVADDVVALAREEQADLLVVGHHPHKALSKLWSVGHHALRLAPMAVAAVPVRASASHGELPLPTVRRLLVATDLTESGDAALPLALALAPPGSQVHLVTVLRAQPSVDERRATERLLRQRVPWGLHGREVLVEVLWGDDPALALTQAAERLDADLVCLGSRGRGTLARAVLGSVAQEVLALSRRPVLVLRTAAR